MVTYEVEEPPLPLLPGDVEHHISREHGIGNIIDLPFKTPDGGSVPANVNNNTLHALQNTNKVSGVCLR